MNKKVFIELIYSCLIGIVVFLLINFISNYFVNCLITHGMVAFTLYEGFAGICFLLYTIVVCFLHFRIPKLGIIPVTFIAFIGAFLVAAADYYVEYYICANNGAYTWNVFITHLQDTAENSFNLNVIFATELWWFIDLLLVGIIAKTIRKKTMRKIHCR